MREKARQRQEGEERQRRGGDCGERQGPGEREAEMGQENNIERRKWRQREAGMES